MLGPLLALVLIWGLNFSVIKSAFDYIGPLGFNALRFPVACLTLLVALRSQRRSIHLPRAALARIAALGIIGHLGYQVLFIYGLSVTLAGTASVLLATTPIWTSLLSAWAGHESVGARLWLAAGGTVVGIGLVAGGGSGIPEGLGSSLTGDLALVLASVVWSIYTVGGRRLVEVHGALRVTAWALWFGTLPVLLVGAHQVGQVRLADLPPAFWLRVLYAGALGIGVAYLIWYHAVRAIGSARTAIFSNAVPVVAMGVAWIWLDERPSVVQLAGALLILAALQLARPARATRPA